MAKQIEKKNPTPDSSRPPTKLLSNEFRLLLRVGIIAGIISSVVGFCGLLVLIGEKCSMIDECMMLLMF